MRSTGWAFRRYQQRRGRQRCKLCVRGLVRNLNEGVSNHNVVVLVVAHNRERTTVSHFRVRIKNDAALFSLVQV